MGVLEIRVEFDGAIATETKSQLDPFDSKASSQTFQQGCLQKIFSRREIKELASLTQRA
jgi:hypothetical protein